MEAPKVPSFEEAVEQAKELKNATARLRDATDTMITTHCDLARQARSSSTSSSKRMKAVRPTEPAPDGDITQRFEAIRANVR